MKKYIKSGWYVGEPDVNSLLHEAYRRKAGAKRTRSSCSFDFVYVSKDYENAYRTLTDIANVTCQEFGLEFIGSDIDSVDYSNYPEYADEEVGQFRFDFMSTESYPAEDLIDMIDEKAQRIGYQIIGYDFYTPGE